MNNHLFNKIYVYKKIQTQKYSINRRKHNKHFMQMNDMYLTNVMSATIAQFKFNATSPKKSSVKHSAEFLVTAYVDNNIRGVDMNRPMAQIMGSILGNRFFKDWLNTTPNDKPTIPATIVISPNKNDKLKNKFMI